MKIFSPNPPTRWVKKRYPLFFRKYEIHKGRHLYRTHKKAGILQCTCRLKKIQIILTEKFNRSITCTNAEIERGRGGRSFFPPTKDIGTSMGDCVGKGKYFPASMRTIAYTPEEGPQPRLEHTGTPMFLSKLHNQCL